MRDHSKCFNKCLRSHCAENTMLCGETLCLATWYCKEHYLEKEAVYGIYDIEEPGQEDFREWGIKRVVEYAKYMMKKNYAAKLKREDL